MVSLTSQLIALRRMAAAESNRALVERRVTSGLNVADRADSTDALARSRTLTRGTTALSATQGSLEAGIATVAAARNAVTATGGVLSSMRALLVSAKDPSADLGALQSQFTALGNALRTSVSGAVFANVNLLATGASASFDAAPADERGRTYAIGVDLARTRLLDPFGTSGILQRRFDLSGVSVAGPSTLGLSGEATRIAGVASAMPTADGLSGTATAVAGEAADASKPTTAGLSGPATTVAGTNATTPSTAGLEGTSATATGVAGKTASGATAAIGTSNASDPAYGSSDSVELQVDLNGTMKLVKVQLANVTNRATLQTELQRVLDGAFDPNVITAKVDATSGKITISTVATGSNQKLDVTGVRVLDSTGAAKEPFGLKSQSNFSAETDSVAGRNVIRDSLGRPNLSGLDTRDKLRLRIDAFELVDNQQTNQVTVTVDVSLANVTDDTSFAKAIHDALKAHSVGKDYFGAALNSPRDAVVYHEKSNGRIKVSNIILLDSNSAAKGGLGFIRGGGTGVSGVDAVQASATTGTDFVGPLTLKNGAALTFDVSLNNAATKTLTINETVVDAALKDQAGYVAGSGRIDNVAQFALVTQQALRNNGIANVNVAASGNKLKFTRTGTAADNDSIALSNVKAVTSQATRAQLTTGSDFDAPITIARNARIDLAFLVNNRPFPMSIIYDDVEKALAGRSGYTSGSGRISSIDDLVRTAQAAMTRQGFSGATATASGKRLVLTVDTPGALSLDLQRVVGSSAATSATATTATRFSDPITLEGDAEIRFDVKVDNNTQTLRITRAGVEAALAGVSGRVRDTGRIETADELATVVQAALRGGGTNNVSVKAVDNRLVLTREAGAGSLALGNVQTVASTARTASLLTGSDFADPVTVEAGASIEFDLALDGQTATRVAIRQSTVEAALGTLPGRSGEAGRIASAAELALVVREALGEARISGIAVDAVGNRIELRKSAAGAGSIDLRALASVSGSTGPASNTTLENLNLAASTTSRLNGTDRTALIDGWIRNLDAIAASVSAAASHLSMVAGQLDIQSAHTTRLQTIETGRLNGQVRTDLDRETARKTALETRLALARQALGIVSESRRNVLNILGTGT